MTHLNHMDIYRSAEEIEQIVIMVRLDLYNRGVAHGAHAIRRYLDEMDGVIYPMPSVSTIGRILCRNGLTYRRTGYLPE